MSKSKLSENPLAMIKLPYPTIVRHASHLLCTVLLFSTVCFSATYAAVSTELQLDASLLELSASTAADSAEQPFTLNLTQQEHLVKAEFTLAPGAYIYKDSLKLAADKAVFSLDPLPQAQLHQDIQGQHEVYFNTLSLSLRLETAADNASVTLTYQGCSADGICYPPTSASLHLQPVSSPKASPDMAADANPSATDGNTAQSTDSRISTLLADNFILGLILCIGLGILLDLTPCVLPMLPVVSAMAAGGNNKSRRQVLVQNLSYSLGLCCCYTVLGLLFAAVGASLQGILQHPALLITIALLLVVCALGCVDIIKLQLPSTLNIKLQQTASHYTSGSLGAAFILGIISALIASPCTSAPLAGALLYVLNSGDLIKGAAAFFAIGLGMSIPLCLIGILGRTALKKAGRFSQMIKKALASILVIAALYLCRNLMAEDIYLYALSSLIFAAIIYIGYERIIDEEKNVQFFPAILLFAGAYFLSEAVYTLSAGNQAHPNEEPSSVSAIFTPIHSLNDLNAYQDKKVFLDFTAAWCTNCQVMEERVFNTEAFAQHSADYVKLQLDITDTSDPEVKAALEHFKIFGVPYFVLLQNGEVQRNAAGYMELDDMLKFIAQ